MSYDQLIMICQSPIVVPKLGFLLKPIPRYPCHILVNSINLQQIPALHKRLLSQNVEAEHNKYLKAPLRNYRPILLRHENGTAVMEIIYKLNRSIITLVVTLFPGILVFVFTRWWTISWYSVTWHCEVTREWIQNATPKTCGQGTVSIET